MSNKDKRAIILGAGPAGLVTAWQLLKKNWKVSIFEKNNIVGGMCRSWKWDDFILDTGPHIFHSPDKSLVNFWKKEFGNLLLENNFWCKNVRGDNFEELWDYPISIQSIKKYPHELRKKILTELKNVDHEKKAKALNFKDYMNAQVGETLTEIFFTSYPNKIWGIKTEDMTPNWAPKRLELRKKNTPFYYGQFSAVGKYGTGCVYDEIKKKILKLNGNFLFNKTINGFNLDRDRKIKKINFVDGSNFAVRETDVIISTLPITITANFLGHKSSLKFRGIKSIYLAYNKPKIFPNNIHWLYYENPKIIFNRVTENKNLSPYVSPKNKSVLTCEITFSEGDSVDKMKDKKLAELVALQVEKVGLVDKKYLYNSSVNSEKFVYPIQTKNYNEELAILKSKISRVERLYSIGTGGDFSYADSQILFHKALDLVQILTEKNSKNLQVLKETAPFQLNKIVELGNRKVGENMKSYIIAEIGLNHNGSLVIAKELISKAKIAGCDAVKLQSYSKGSRVSGTIKAEKYVEKIIGLEESMSSMFDRLILSKKDQIELFDFAKKKKIEIFSTPFDEENLEFLESQKIKFYKIASSDLVNLPLIEKISKTGKPAILSCGMSTIGQLDEAIEVFASTGNKNLILLHCNSSYPADPEEMNLNTIKTLRRYYGIPVGLSDHTFGIFISQMALALGANIIERHFTLNREMEGPDHVLSSELEEMTKLVDSSKKIPVILGDGIKKIQPNEYLNLNLQRKSIFAKIKIKKGEIISEKKLIIKGPAGGILPKYMNIVIGRKAKENIDKDFPVTWELI